MSKKPHFSPTNREIAILAEARALTRRAKPSRESADDLDDVDGFGRPFNWTPPALRDYNAPSNRRSEPNAMVAMAGDGIHTIYQGSQRRADRGGFADFGVFAMAVKTAAGEGREALRTQEHLTNALSTFGSEGVGPDGGYAVPPEFRSTIMQKVMGEESLLSRCDQVFTESSSVAVPKDETTPWGTTGIQGYWDGEAHTLTQKKPVLENSVVKLHKITSLVPVTDELLEDAPMLATYIPSKAGEVFAFKTTDAIINGTGAGQPLGILNAPHTITQAKEGSQIADTVHGQNLIRMWGRMPGNWRSDAVWLVHPDAEPQLMSAGLQITSADGNTTVGGGLAWLPANSVAGQPYATLFGRPVIPTHACAALGDRGDIIFASLQQYAAFLRSGGMRSDTSIHMWFDQGITAFRFVFRLGGQPWWSAPITDKNGSNTRAAFVALEAR